VVAVTDVGSSIDIAGKFAGAVDAEKPTKRGTGGLNIARKTQTAVGILAENGNVAGNLAVVTQPEKGAASSLAATV